MKPPNRTFRFVFATLTILALPVFGQTPFAAGTVGRYAEAQPTKAVVNEKISPLTVSILEPNGDRGRLIYIPVEGWKRVDGDRDADLTSTALIRTATRPAEKKPTVGNPPLSVFIDGPTGNTFVYVLDEGWQFVGRVADKHD